MLTCKGIVAVQQNQDSLYYRSPITIKVDAARLQRIPWAALYTTVSHPPAIHCQMYTYTLSLLLQK